MQIVIGHILHGVKLKHVKMNFYTDIQTIEMFDVIFTLIKPCLPNIIYLTALAKHRVTSTKIMKHSVIESPKKLTQRHEFL